MACSAECPAPAGSPAGAAGLLALAGGALAYLGLAAFDLALTRDPMGVVLIAAG